MSALEKEQRDYLNGELQKLLNGLYDAQVLGKMNKETCGSSFEFYDW